MRLNLCSGQRPFSGNWINVDRQSKWNPDVCENAEAYLARLAENSVDMIVIHHGLEHYGCGEGDELLRLCRNALKPGGSLLIFVPNMDALCRAWLDGRMDDQVFFTNVYGAYCGDEADRHKWSFTRGTLEATLKQAGFRAPRPFDWRHIEAADLARDWWVLAMEGVK